MSLSDLFHSVPYGHTLWNLFLAAIPLVLAWALAWGLGRQGKKRNLPRFVNCILAAVWLAFLPNTCYLLTEWRHLLFDDRWAELLRAGDTDRSAMLATARWALLFLAYSGIGVLLFALSIRPVERSLRASGINATLLAPPFFFLISLGVYLGLIVRLNSWDMIQRPAAVWNSAADALTTAAPLQAIVVFAVVLWILYEAVDLWLDGVADRLRRFGGRNAKPAEA